MPTDEALAGARGQPNCSGDEIGSLVVEVGILEIGRVHPRVGDQDPFQSVERQNEGLAVQDR